MFKTLSRSQPAAPSLVSIIVGTYNRGAKLRNFLKSLLNMNVPASTTWELICVDNNSSDNTKRVVEEFARNSPAPILYVFEATQGTSHARNAGLRHAQGEIIIIIDDDCIADIDWLVAICNEFEADPALDVLGGRVELYNNEDLPLTLRRFKNKIDFTPDRLFYLIPGCNMAVRRRVVTKVGAFDPIFGPGAKLPSAEDVDFIYRAFKAGCKIAYSPFPIVYHDHGRRTELDRKNLNRSYVIGRGAFYCKYMLRGDIRVARMACWLTVRFLGRSLKNATTRGSDGTGLKSLGYLVKGAFLYLWIRIRSAIGRPP